jgi:peptidoglycan/xylan/chitin deacetylase (PgdA/CDA1 family)
MSVLTIVMYHYVRDLERSRYPAIKARTIREFEAQLDYLASHHTVCSTADVVAAVRGERALPPSACLLTFDDGLIDHFTAVLPRLVARGLTASFYPPVAAVAQSTVLDTHKIHFILASAPDHVALARHLRDLVDKAGRAMGLPSARALWDEWARPSVFDPAEVVFVKRVLQRGLPEAVRAAMTAALFDEYVGVPEAVFARELYMDATQLRCLIANGMEVGGHGAAHVWLDALPAAAQRDEIADTVRFLAGIHGRAPVDWVMCYPFGAFTAETTALLSEHGCALGLTTRFDTVRDLKTPLELPRLDTNHVPPCGEPPGSGRPAWHAAAGAARGR